ncbi:MAG: LytR family transcriptional protein, partial [Anaerolineales bacterium]|nr:LytR family transcriptional protein [Anaerolineales bacterium]
MALHRSPGDTQPRNPRNSPAGAPAKGAASPRSGRSWAVVAAISGVFGLALLASAALVHLATRELAIAWTFTGLNPFQPSPGQGSFPGTTPAPGETPAAAAFATPVAWSGAERVTILLMGLDYRDWSSGRGFPRTDSMMLISIDPITRKAAMLSIPRDLWVEIPGFGHERINTAYPSGENNRLPGGGPELAMRTVESVVGVPVQYYAVIEFGAFEDMIDEIGGIDVTVAQRMKISPIGRPSIWLDAEPTHLDGPQALAYARIRKVSGDDFGRAERQQQVAFAVLDRVVGFEMVPTLITRAPALWAELQSGIRTNMTLEQMISLGW